MNVAVAFVVNVFVAFVVVVNVFVDGIYINTHANVAFMIRSIV